MRTNPETFRARRERLELSRAKLAGLSRCSHTLLSLAENGGAPQRSRKLAEVEKVLRGLEAAQGIPVPPDRS